MHSQHSRTHWNATGEIKLVFHEIKIFTHSNISPFWVS